MKSHKEITHYSKPMLGFGIWKIEHVDATKLWHLTVRLEKADPTKERNPSHQLMAYQSPEEAAAALSRHWPVLLSWDRFLPLSEEDCGLPSWVPHEERVVDSL
jgi:hypothetical protein